MLHDPVRRSSIREQAHLACALEITGGDDADHDGKEDQRAIAVLIRRRKMSPTIFSRPRSPASSVRR